MAQEYWFLYTSFADGLTAVDEQDHCRFYHIAQGEESLLIDSGLGLTQELSNRLFADLGVGKQPVVLNTHLHCDHIGMNHLASKVIISRSDWDMFSQGIMFTLRNYFEIFGEDMLWPSGFSKHDLEAKNWQPSDFMMSGDIYIHGAWKLECLTLPGHTAGHNIYFDRNKKVIFLGDLIYDGAIYLHMYDSNAKKYRESLAVLLSLIDDLGDDVLLLSSHNSLPLEVGFVGKLKFFMDEILDRQIQPVGRGEKSESFDGSLLFKKNNMTIYVRAKEYHSL